MKTLFRSFLLSVLVGISACSGVDASPSGTKPTAPSYESELKKTSGIHTGNPTAEKTVYVFFDMQCPHCGHMWNTAKQSSDVKIVWIPVGILSQASLNQGAVLLSSKTPYEVMEEHESSLLARRGGITTLGVQLAPDSKDKMNNNTQAFSALNLSSVPFVIMKSTKGTYVANEGAMGLSQFKEFVAQ